jgi:hypothetical protein
VNYERDKDGAKLDFGGMNLILPPDRMPPNKYPFAQNVRRYIHGGITGRTTQDSTVFSFPSSVHSIRRLNDLTPNGPAGGYVLVSGAGRALYSNNAQVDSSLSGNPISLVPFRPATSVQPWMYVGDSLKMDKVRSDGTCYKTGIKEPQAAPAIQATSAATKVSTVGPITAYYWGDSPHSGPVAVYIWKNGGDPGGSGPVRGIANAAGNTVGNSLLFDIPPAAGSPSVPVQWTQYDTNTPPAITGTIDLFQPALESQGYSDFNVSIIGTLYIPIAGNYTFTGTFKDDIIWGIGGGATMVSGSGIKAIAGQTLTAIKGYPLFRRVTESSGLGGGTGSVNCVVNFPTAGNYPFEIDWDYWYHSGRIMKFQVNGQDIPPISSSVFVGAQYRYTYRSSATGATSNPSPASAQVNMAVASTGVTPTASPDPQVDKIDFYRLDQGLLQYTYVGTGPNNSVPFNDTLLDTDVGGNPLLEFDNFEPFPSIDLPRKGTVNVSTGVVTWVSGDQFNIRWLPGTIIIIGTVAYTLTTRPTSAVTLTASNSVLTNGVETVSVPPDGTNLPYEISEPDLAAQPLPFLWGPTDNVAFIFGVGDPLRPGTLYWCKGNEPDSAPDTNQQDVTSPSEPLMNGCIVSGFGMVFSTERAWIIWPNYFNALATVNGTVGSTWTLQESISTRGLFIATALAVDGGGNVFFRAKDGIYKSPNGSGAESITDADLYNLFPHEGRVPQPVTIAGQTVYPPDDLQPARQRMSCATGYLYYDYVDTTGIPRTLVFDIAANAWVWDVYQFPVRVHALEEGPNVNDVIVGCENGTMRRLDSFGVEMATAYVLMPSFNAGDGRAQKHWGDIYTEIKK